MPRKQKQRKALEGVRRYVEKVTHTTVARGRQRVQQARRAVVRFLKQR